MADVTLRTYIFLDDLQPQLAAFIGTTARGFLPVAGVASMFIETAPGLIINRLMDVALKATSCTPAIMVVERAFGLLEIHDWDKGQVETGGRAVLDYLKLEEHDRVKPRIVSDQIIRSVEPYHAQLINKIRYGDQLLSGESLLILETEPAAYIAFAANQALKSAPALSNRSTSSTERTPPPTVNGMKTCSAVRRTTSYMVSRSPLLAVMSRKTSSSAPSAS